MSDIERESMEFDVVIVGAGPAGLAAAIRLKQVNPELSVVVLEKGGKSALTSCPAPSSIRSASTGCCPTGATTATTRSRRPSPTTISWSSGRPARSSLPNIFMPPLMNNHGNYIVSLGNVCRWLATKAEALGVEIYPGFAAAEVIYNEKAPLPASTPATWASSATARTARPSRQAWR
jgi:electron-transferring-flavoprotein dehydrogenase